MDSLWERVERAFSTLEAQSGYETRPVQRQMARYVLKSLAHGQSGVVEAPTGVGKSLAVLLPAIALCVAQNKRVVISTYTNVLAEQYWNKDLPLALSLFPESTLSCVLAMGRSRYACIDRILGKRASIRPADLHQLLMQWVHEAVLGIEGELASYFRAQEIPAQFTPQLWEQISAPVACRASFCPFYESCFFYKSRERNLQASLIITNHALVLTDMRIRQVTDNAASLLGDFDYLVIDEAHDLPNAAESVLEVQLSSELVQELIRVAVLLSNQMSYALEGINAPLDYLNTVQLAVQEFAQSLQVLFASEMMGNLPPEGLITSVVPEELVHYLKGTVAPQLHTVVSEIATQMQSALTTLLERIHQGVDNPSQFNEVQRNAIREVLAQFESWFKATYASLQTLIQPPEGVCWVEPDRERAWKACYQPITISEALQRLLYSRVPTLMVSATLTIDNRFDFFLEQVGLNTHHQLQLSPVFDYPRQCAIYLPPVGTIPQPPTSSRAPDAERYYQCVAQELTRILQATQGRALVLFASRAEMEAVRRQMPNLPGIPIYMQGESANADLSRRFREETHSVLFGLRSFWTGFDAPGDTLVNLVLVRIPFEVPTTPIQRARDALLTWQGKDSFLDWSLPNTKQQIKQGFGRLIRKATDRGVVCLLDARFHTKAYGAEIMRNLPSGIPVFHDIHQAVRHVGL